MLDGKVILVTNVTEFVGPASVAALRTNGATVLAHDPSFKTSKGRDAFAGKTGDVVLLEAEEPNSLVEEALSHHGRIDVLVNNDVYPAERAPLEEATDDQLRAVLEALTIRPFSLAGAIVPTFRSQGAGKIIMVTSAAPLRGLPNYSMYATARGATNAMTVSLARELARDNIQVNALAPNYVATPAYFPDELMQDRASAEKILKNVPLGRLGKPEEAGATIAFLASPGADFITGLVLPFAGGWA